MEVEASPPFVEVAAEPVNAQTIEDVNQTTELVEGSAKVAPQPGGGQHQPNITAEELIGFDAFGSDSQLGPTKALPGKVPVTGTGRLLGVAALESVARDESQRTSVSEPQTVSQSSFDTWQRDVNKRKAEVSRAEKAERKQRQQERLKTVPPTVDGVAKLLGWTRGEIKLALRRYDSAWQHILLKRAVEQLDPVAEPLPDSWALELPPRHDVEAAALEPLRVPHVQDSPWPKPIPEADAAKQTAEERRPSATTPHRMRRHGKRVVYTSGAARSGAARAARRRSPRRTRQPRQRPHAESARRHRPRRAPR